MNLIKDSICAITRFGKNQITDFFLSINFVKKIGIGDFILFFIGKDVLLLCLYVCIIKFFLSANPIRSKKKKNVYARMHSEYIPFRTLSYSCVYPAKALDTPTR